MGTLKSIKSVKAGGKPATGGVKVRIALQPSADAQAFYANFLEVAHGPHDLTIYGVRIPAKLNLADKDAATTTGELQLEPEFQIVISPTLAPGLIRALQSQVDQWEKEFGSRGKGGNSEIDK